MAVRFRPLVLAALGMSALGASACAPLRSHQGYVVDADLVNAIRPGIDNRDSVAATLGQPTLKEQFGGGDWLYVSRDSRNMAFNNPQPYSQLTLRIAFDAKGDVRAVSKSGVELASEISPVGDKTPTLGRKRGFFEDLFGNIGTVGAGPGAGGGGGADGP